MLFVVLWLLFFLFVYLVCMASRAFSSGNHTYFTFRWENLYFERALNCTLGKVGALIVRKNYNKLTLATVAIEPIRLGRVGPCTKAEE